MQYHHRASRPQGRKKPVYASADLDEQEPASPHRAGHYAGLHAEDTPYTTTAEVQQHLAPRQAYPSGKLAPRSAFRYRPMEDFIRDADAIEMPDGVLYRQGSDQIYAHNGPPPASLRARRTAERRIPQRAASYERETEPQASRPRQPRRRFHWLFFLGLALLAMLAGYVGINAFGAWWQVHTDDGTYGRPRTFQADAVVGHHDSESHPSHFLALNLNRYVIVIEIPGGDVSKSVIYSGPVLLGNGQDLTPVTLSFSDVNGDGKPDMVLHILDQTIIFINNGTKFVPPASLVRGGIAPPTPGGEHAAGENPHHSRLL